MRQSLYDFCQEHSLTRVLEQWDTQQNAPLTPQTVSYGSRQKVWWQCERGHRWQAAVYARSDGSGCPCCTGKRACPGENDLASQIPELAAQWHPRKNGALTPDMVVPGSHRRVWWRCEKGHEWQAQVKSRAAGSGCPICKNRAVVPGKNDLPTTHPTLAAQWHPVKNGALAPSMLVAGSCRKVWWQCGRGHVWQASVSSRALNGAGCPYCSGKRVIAGETDLATCFPAISQQWLNERNGMLTPERVSPFSNRRVWWQCAEGHIWQAAVSARTAQLSGCPYCTGKKVLTGFNDLATLEPAVASQWHAELNGTLTPQMLTPGSHQKVWWQCPEGHIWKAVVHSRTGAQRCGCPVCAGKVKPSRETQYRQALVQAALANRQKPV